MAETAQLNVRLDLTGNFSSGITKAQGQLNGLARSAGRVGKGIGQVGAGFARAGLLVGGAAVAGLTAAGKAAIDYEDAFAGVRKTVEATEPELAKLSTQFRDMAKEIPIAATEFARLGEIAGALGIETDAIDEFARTTALLGVTTDLTADAAADALGRIGNIMNLTAEEYDNFGSALVNLGNKGASTEPEIIEITKRFAAAGKQAGLSAIEVLGLAEATASFTGLNPEAAGSSLSRLTGTLTKVVAGGGAEFKLLNKIVGTDFRKALDKDASGALLRFLKGLKKLDKYERAGALKELGLDSVYLRQLLGGLIDNIDGVELSLANADAGWKGNFLNEEAEKKFNTVASAIQLLRNNIYDAGITIGTGFLPALKRTTDRLIAFLKVDANQSALKGIGEDIGKALDAIDWKQVLDGARSFVGVLKTSVSIAESLLKAISLLPGEVKAAAAAFLVLNKASGGLIGAGVGNVVGGVAETVVRGLGSKLPKVGSLFAQPVFVTNWPVGFGAGGATPTGGGGGGAVRSAAKAAAVVLAPLSVLEIGSAIAGAQRESVNRVINSQGNIVRSVTDAGQKIANVRASIAMLEQRVAGGDSVAAGQLEQQRALLATMIGETNRNTSSTIEAGAKAKNAGMQTKEQIASSAMIQQALLLSQMATTRTTAASTQGAVRNVAPPIVGAIQRNRPHVTTIVNVTATHVTKQTTIQNRYGPGNGSSGRDQRSGELEF